MKKIKGYMLLCIFSIISQTALAQSDSCTFLKNISSSNKSDTITIEGNYRGIFRLDDFPAMKKLHMEKKLDTKKFNYAISFTTPNCPTLYNAPSSYNLPDNRGFNLGATLYFTCVIFRGYEGFDNRPLFVVINVASKKP